MTLVAVHYFGKADQVLSEKRSIRYVYSDFSNLPHARGVAAESFPLWCHGYQWEVLLYPGGDNQSNEDTVFISVYLKCLSATGGEEVKASAEFRINHHAYKFESIVFASKTKGFGYYNFVSRTDVLDRAKRFLVDGTLTVDVIIQVCRDKVPIGKGENTLLVDMRNLFQSASDSSDTKFAVRNESFSAHLAILRARAPALAALATDYPSNTTIPILGDITPRSFGTFLRYIYTDELPASEEFQRTAIELLNVADCFDCRGLKFAAEAEIITTGINVNTVVSLILLGEAKHCALLKEAAMDFFVANSSSVMISDEWVNTPKSVDFVTELLSAVVPKNRARPENENDYDQMRVSRLREKLKECGLDIDGSKQMLIRRLKEAKEGDSKIK